jgi:hypothetical protein
MLCLDHRPCRKRASRRSIQWEPPSWKSKGRRTRPQQKAPCGDFEKHFGAPTQPRRARGCGARLGACSRARIAGSPRNCCRVRRPRTLVRRENEELRCILNSIHTRQAAYVVRTVGDQHEPRQFSTWSAKAVALIGRLPETLGDRSIIVPMRRRGPGKSVERLRLDRPAACMGLHRRAARWAADHLDELTDRDPEVPRELNDRAADNWRPLLAIADAAGGEWSEQARSAALALSGEAADSEDSIRELLLADIRTVFRERKETRIFSDDLVVALCHREERPWSDWKHGNPLSPVQLARLLKPFGVGPGQMRSGTRTGKGYELKEFADAFARYLPPLTRHIPMLTRVCRTLRPVTAWTV